MLKIRRSRDRLIFNMGIPIPEKDNLYIEAGRRFPSYVYTGPTLILTHQHQTKHSLESAYHAMRTPNLMCAGSSRHHYLVTPTCWSFLYVWLVDRFIRVWHSDWLLISDRPIWPGLNRCPIWEIKVLWYHSTNFYSLIFWAFRHFLTFQVVGCTEALLVNFSVTESFD